MKPKRRNTASPPRPVMVRLDEVLRELRKMRDAYLILARKPGQDSLKVQRLIGGMACCEQARKPIRALAAPTKARKPR